MSRTTARHRRFSAMFVVSVLLLGWFCRVMQEYDLLPWWLRVAGGVVSVVLLREWLTRRLDLAATTSDGEA